MRQRRKESKEGSGSLTENVTKQPTSDQSKWISKRLLHVFDCIWTFVLLLAACIIIIALIPSIEDFLFGTLHVYLYQINRYARFGFIAMHPYLLYAGLDLTNQCLIQNPLANDTTRCPCINQPYPIDITINYSSLPEEVYNNPFNVYILRSTIPIEDKDYGRETLVKYLEIHGQTPQTSYVTIDGLNGPGRMQQLIDESTWNKWKSLNTSWDFSWIEFATNRKISIPPVNSLLPPLDSLFKGYDFIVSSSICQYSISTQWGKSKSHRFDQWEPPSNGTSVMILLVINGTVRVTIGQAGHQCWDYCLPSYEGSLLYPGDALLYDERHWTFKTQTWSNKSFTMLKKFTFEKN